MIYKLINNQITKEPCGAYYIDEQNRTISFVFDEANTDYQAYLKWLDEGNEPLPADE